MRRSSDDLSLRRDQLLVEFVGCDNQGSLVESLVNCVVRFAYDAKCSTDKLGENNRRPNFPCDSDYRYRWMIEALAEHLHDNQNVELAGHELVLIAEKRLLQLFVLLGRIQNVRLG